MHACGPARGPSFGECLALRDGAAAGHAGSQRHAAQVQVRRVGAVAVVHHDQVRAVHAGTGAAAGGRVDLQVCDRAAACRNDGKRRAVSEVPGVTRGAHVIVTAGIVAVLSQLHAHARFPGQLVAARGRDRFAMIRYAGCFHHASVRTRHRAGGWFARSGALIQPVRVGVFHIAAAAVRAGLRAEADRIAATASAAARATAPAAARAPGATATAPRAARVARSSSAARRAGRARVARGAPRTWKAATGVHSARACAAA